MRVLVACEFSGVVRDAFLAQGHEALSVDLLPSERPGPHLIGDATLALLEPWDLVIAHPPCTYLCNSGSRWMKDNPERQGKAREAAAFFLKCLRANSPRVCVENPIMHHWGRETIRMHDQIIQPWMFGHHEVKRSCLWLKGLPELKPTKVVYGTQAKSWLAPDSKDRWKNRSRTLTGVAEAMADQWGEYL